MKLLICFFISLSAFSQTPNFRMLDYLYYFPVKGESVLDFAVYVSIDEMEFNNRASGIEEIPELDRAIITAAPTFRYSLVDKLLIQAGIEWEFADIETHLEDESDTEYPAKTAARLYNPAIDLRYRFVDKDEVFIDLEAGFLFSSYNSEHSPVGQSIDPFEGQDQIRVKAVVGIDFKFFRLMNSIGTVHHEGGLINSKFSLEKLDAEESQQVVLSTLVQADLSPNYIGGLGFSFYSADAFDLRGDTEVISINSSTQKNFFAELDYLGKADSIGILTFKVNYRMDLYVLKTGPLGNYVADHTFVDFIFQLEKWF